MTHWRLDGHGVKGRAAFARERIGERWEQRRELAGGEGVQGPEALGKLEGGQAAVAIELAEKVLRRLFPFLRIAFETAGDEVFVGIAPPTGRAARRGRGTERCRWSGADNKSIGLARAHG